MYGVCVCVCYLVGQGQVALDSLAFPGILLGKCVYGNGSEAGGRVCVSECVSVYVCVCVCVCGICVCVCVCIVQV